MLLYCYLESCAEVIEVLFFYNEYVELHGTLGINCEHVFQAISESVNQQEDDSLLKCLVELAESVPKFVRPQVENVLTFCMKVSVRIKLCCRLYGHSFLQSYVDGIYKEREVVDANFGMF